MGTSIATIIAIIVGPVLAIQIQKFIEWTTQRRGEKRKLFMTLMSTRGQVLAPEHVQALNMIEVVFTDKKDTLSDRLSGGKKNIPVLDAWHTLRDHFNRYPELPTIPAEGDIKETVEQKYQSDVEDWEDKRQDLLVELLSTMAESLGYHYDNVLIKRGAYTPDTYRDLELCQRTALQGWAEVFLGMRSIPMKLTGMPRDEEAADLLKGVLKGSIPLQVQITEGDLPDTSNRYGARPRKPKSGKPETNQSASDG